MLTECESPLQENVDPYIFSSLRFVIAALAFSPILRRAVQDPQIVRGGIEIGIWAAGGQWSQESCARGARCRRAARRTAARSAKSCFGSGCIRPCGVQRCWNACLVWDLSPPPQAGRTRTQQPTCTLRAAYITQSVGMVTGEASRGAFLTGLTVVVVPVCAGLSGSGVKRTTWVAVAVAVVGVWLLEGSGSPPTWGDLWNLASAVLFSLQVRQGGGVGRCWPASDGGPEECMRCAAACAAPARCGGRAPGERQAGRAIVCVGCPYIPSSARLQQAPESPEFQPPSLDLDSTPDSVLSLARHRRPAPTAPCLQIFRTEYYTKTYSSKAGLSMMSVALVVIAVISLLTMTVAHPRQTAYFLRHPGALRRLLAHVRWARVGVGLSEAACSSAEAVVALLFSVLPLGMHHF